MIQHLIITHQGQRLTIVLEYVAQEYGISEQSFWSCWFAHRKHINGDGDTLEDAFKDLIMSWEYKEEMWRISADMRKNMDEVIKGSVGIRCPVVAG